MTKIVRIGGGSSAQVLRGLKRLVDTQVTAIVPMADSGGSSGVLRNQWGVLPPSDALRSLLAFSDLPKTQLRGVAKVLSRILTVNGLAGQKGGNVLLSGFQLYTRSFEVAVEGAAEMLEVNGHRVVPVTTGDAHAFARLTDGTIIPGETHIDVPEPGRPILPIVELWLEPQVQATEAALRAIAEADAVVIGPSDLYSSIGCCLVVEGIPEALQRTSAKLVFAVNLTTKKGETGGFEDGHPDFTASDFLRVVEGWIQRPMNWVLFNSEPFSEDVLENYAIEFAVPVASGDLIPVPSMSGQQSLFAAVSEVVTKDDGLRFVRHHPRKTAQMIGLIVGATFERRAHHGLDAVA